MHRTWSEIVAADPGHSRRYAERWANFAAQGRDFDGEALSTGVLCYADEPGNAGYAGQGNHQSVVADVDSDGKDEP